MKSLVQDHRGGVQIPQRGEVPAKPRPPAPHLGERYCSVADLHLGPRIRNVESGVPEDLDAVRAQLEEHLSAVVLSPKCRHRGFERIDDC